MAWAEGGGVLDRVVQDAIDRLDEFCGEAPRFVLGSVEHER